MECKMRKKHRAVITVFFCLLSVAFMGFCFTIVEAVRFSGARAQCANVTSLGLWSVFSEYENILLEDYSLFAVDAAYGGDLVSRERLTEKLSSYIKENENVTKELSSKLPGLLLDPWKVSAGEVKIDQYALLTDRGGEYYYQQAVEYMAKTGWANAIGKLKDAYRDAEGIREVESEYENNRKASEEDMKEVKSGAKDAKKELSTVTITDEYGNETEVTDSEAAERVKKQEAEGKKKDPTQRIEEMRKEDLLK